MRYLYIYRSTHIYYPNPIVPPSPQRTPPPFIFQLSDYGIPHDEVAFGKPYAQFYIDDLAVSAFHDLHKALGFYPNSPLCDASAPPPVLPPAAPAKARGAAPAATDLGDGANGWLPLAVSVAVAGIVGLVAGIKIHSSVAETFRGVAAAAASSAAFKATL